MRETRRRFMMALAAAGACLAAQDTRAFGQEKHRGFPDPPESAAPKNPDQDPAQAANLRAAKKAMAQRNEKEFREGVERLHQLATELKEEVQKTPTTDVLSVRMYKKAEEIEKLAKHVKSKAKGG
jgi:acyl-CoA reductase-like NAD-dependent aldehyde dehydrogenase